MTARIGTASARVSLRMLTRLLGILTLVVGLGLVASCSGEEDASGTWEIRVPTVSSAGPGTEEAMVPVRAEIQQAEDGGALSGSATASVGDVSCSYDIVDPQAAAEAGVPASRLHDEGEITLTFNSDVIECGPFTLDGTISGDEITGEARDPQTDLSVPSESLVIADDENDAYYAPSPKEFTAERVAGE